MCRFCFSAISGQVYPLLFIFHVKLPPILVQPACNKYPAPPKMEEFVPKNLGESLGLRIRPTLDLSQLSINTAPLTQTSPRRLGRTQYGHISYIRSCCGITCLWTGTLPLLLPHWDCSLIAFCIFRLVQFQVLFLACLQILILRACMSITGDWLDIQ